MIISKSDLLHFFENVKTDFDIFIPYASELDEDNLSYKKFSDNKEFIINKYRTIDPIKTLFYLPIESVLPASAKKMKRIIVGVKNCDLLALEVLDSALLEDNFVEPNYKIWRDNTYIISSDCTDALSSCHCVLLDYPPYPEKSEDGTCIYDLNLSPVNDNFLITIGSKKGDELLELIKKYCSVRDASYEEKNKIEAQHAEIRKKLSDINSDYSPDRKYDVISDNKDEATWKELSAECVECGGCTNICPTCYCIILNDESENGNFKKIRTWDSCQLSGYARVAGGDSPRPKLWERFRHRYQTKFIRINNSFSKLGCTGCGRCISTCPAGIDLREVIQSLQEV
ncbi:MAG: 4Fe-4S dicluster domain-containing protein [Candidatus Cloacimonetes bacterium]|nr:4Fe-4S dicluster domain-containing protein [Candidatus Cloacimonadota bacterium]